MKNLLLPVFALLLIFSACKKNESETTACDIQDPLETIDWLKDIHFAFQASASPQAKSIIQYTYQGECVFYIDACVGCPDGGQTVYNEQQEIICEFGTIAGLNTCPDFQTDATDKVVLFGD